MKILKPKSLNYSKNSFNNQLVIRSFVEAIKNRKLDDLSDFLKIDGLFFNKSKMNFLALLKKNLSFYENCSVLYSFGYSTSEYPSERIHQFLFAEIESEYEDQFSTSIKAPTFILKSKEKLRKGELLINMIIIVNDGVISNIINPSKAVTITEYRKSIKFN